MAEKQQITLSVVRVQQLRHLLTYVDAKNKQSRAFLETVVYELDTILKPFEQTAETK